MIKIVGVGEYTVSSCENDIIKTFAMGSCVAVVVYNPIGKVLGMVHVALPNSNIDKDKKHISLRGYFADIAVPLIFNKVFGGYPPNNYAYTVSLYGGVYSKYSNDIFNVGVRNLKEIEKILISHHIKFDSSNTGGYHSRTIEADVGTGKIIVSSQPMVI